MVDLLEDLENWILSKDIFTEEEKEELSFFYDYMPSDPPNVVILFEYDSTLSPVKGNEAAVRYVAVQVRNEKGILAKQISYKLFQCFMLPEENFSELPSGRLILSSPKNNPLKLSADTETVVWGFNVAITTNTN